MDSESNSTTSNQVNVYYAKVRGMRVTTLNSTSATVRWYRIGPDDHFRYSINTSPFPSTDFATSDSVVTFNNLQPSTTYYVFAQAACGSSFQNWSDYTTISFTTCATNINTAITPAIGFTCTGSQLLSTSGGSSYQWLYNSIPIPGATSNTFQASNSGNYSVIINTDACSYSASNNATILWHSLPAGTCEWTGFQDTDWSNPVNWKCGTLPTSTSNVIIPNATRYPVLNQNWTIRSLNVKPNATLVVAPGVILTVTN